MQQEKSSLSRTISSVYRVKWLFHETKVNVGQALQLLYIWKQSQHTAQNSSWRFNGYLQHTNRTPRSSAAGCYLVLRDWTKPKCSEKSHNNITLNRSRNLYENQNNKTVYLWGNDWTTHFIKHCNSCSWMSLWSVRVPETVSLCVRLYLRDRE